MKTLLTPKLLEFLIQDGYRYCFSKTTTINHPNAQLCITLSPVRERPAPGSLTTNADTFFPLKREPARMAYGITNTLIYVEVPAIVLLRYIDSHVFSFNFSGRSYA